MGSCFVVDLVMSAVSHLQCGLRLFLAPQGDSCIVFNLSTGGSRHLAGLFDLEFDEEGWYTTNPRGEDTESISLSNGEFAFDTNVATSPDGRGFMQTAVAVDGHHPKHFFSVTNMAD